MLRARTHPTAIISWEDRIAAKLLQSAREQGIDVPRRVSVIGCANMEFAELLSPALTTVEQRPEEIGRQAIALVIQRKEEQDSLPIQTISLPVELIERASCVRPI